MRKPSRGRVKNHVSSASPLNPLVSGTPRSARRCTPSTIEVYPRASEYVLDAVSTSIRTGPREVNQVLAAIQHAETSGVHLALPK